MSNKVSIEDISQALKQAKITSDQHATVINYLSKVIEEEKLDKQNTEAPKQKNEFGIIIYDAENKLKGLEISGAIYTIPQNSDHGLVLGKISDAAREQTAAAKRKKFTIDSIGSAFQNIKRKFIKDKGVMIKTKNPVRVLISNNQLV